MQAAELDQQLRGYTVVLSMVFELDPDDQSCTLRLRLATSERRGSNAIDVEFVDVGQLQIRDFGAGVTQVLHLRVEDVSHDQLDRINLRVVEVERGSISFTCRSARSAVSG